MRTQFICLALAIALMCPVASGQWVQQGNKLVGMGAAGSANQGCSVSLSSDGNTAIVGGRGDSSSAGAAWVFTRSGGVWSQLGSKLVGTNAVGIANQGISVSLSADGNTAIVGGSGDSSGVGAAWVFIRNGGVWSQQGNKLVGTGAVDSAEQGSSVALSADGNTAIVGGSGDSSSVGAAWVFIRVGGVWSQQGVKLVGAGAVGYAQRFAQQGCSVSLSADGNTAIVGGNGDDDYAGAAWVFTRTGGVWSQQGSKLVGTGTGISGGANQGRSVALSADGNTALVGGPFDNFAINDAGAVWVFTRTNGAWSQQGNKLVGIGRIGRTLQGISVGVSGDGNIALVGGYADHSGAGASWVFTRTNGVWTQQGSKLFGAGAVEIAYQGHSVAISADGNTIIVGGDNDNFGVGAAWVFTQSGTSIHEETANVPSQFVLEQNFPNPFNPSTTIRYGLPQRSQVTLTVYNPLGQSVSTLVNGEEEAGYHEVKFDGSRLSSGVYFYRIQARSFVETRKLIYLR